MRVLTIDNAALQRLASELAVTIAADYGPDIVIAIRSGGVPVAEAMMAAFGERPAFDAVTVRRSSSNGKKGSSLLRMLPRWLCDMLRKMESVATSLRSHGGRLLPRDVDMTLEEPTADMLKAGGHKVLVVDDAIDTGSSAAAALEYLSKTFPSNDYRMAVITQTLPHPAIIPEYAVFRDRTLVRFPWSADNNPCDE